MTTSTAITINIPKPIPALKIPSIASQELNRNKSKNIGITRNRLWIVFRLAFILICV